MITELIEKRTWLQWIATAFIVSLLGVRGHTARADAPAGRYKTKGTEVTDTKTGLVWKKTEEGEGAFRWTDAKAQCTSLGGKWRLPNIRELQSLVDETRSAAPTIDTTAFPGARNGTLWSSSAYALSSGNAWYVYFVSGAANASQVTSATAGVRCVR